MKTIESQEKRILAYLKKKGRSLTPLQALGRFDCWSLSSRIARINKQQGRIIKSELIKLKSGKHVSRYSMI